MGLAARQGIMPNGGGEAFQSFTNIDALAFDKTGTITEGKFVISDERDFDLLPQQMLWSFVAAVEQASSHPIALAIHAFARKKLEHYDSKIFEGGDLKILDVQEVPGRGLHAQACRPDGTTWQVYIGNEKMIIESGGMLSAEVVRVVQTWREQGKSIVLVGMKEYMRGEEAGTTVQLASILAVADPLRPEARFVLDYLRNKGIEVFIVSGDGPATVTAVARSLGIPDSHAVGGALPDDKRRFVEDIQGQIKRKRAWNGKMRQTRKLVAFVGDGINDTIGERQLRLFALQLGLSDVIGSSRAGRRLDRSRWRKLRSNLVSGFLAPDRFAAVYHHFAGGRSRNVQTHPQ